MRLLRFGGVAIAFFMLGFAAAIWFMGAFRSSVTLPRSVTVYDGTRPVAALSNGAVLVYDDLTGQHTLGFYLDSTNLPTHRLREVYYSDTPSRTDSESDARTGD